LEFESLTDQVFILFYYSFLLFTFDLMRRKR
jgi:hypothetical protein